MLARSCSRAPYVPREAGPGDDVCVTPETRAQAQYDNRQAKNRLAYTDRYTYQRTSYWRDDLRLDWCLDSGSGCGQAAADNFCNRKRWTGAAAFAEDESNIDDVALESLNPFDTILLRTYNSDYRILLLDPKTGRALVEGGEYLVEPNEALVRGSAIPGSEFKAGSICVGSRLEIWVNEGVVLTSAIKSVHVKHSGAAESVENISTALH